MKILKNPWKDNFIELVSESKSSIKITSPFVKKNICDDLLLAKPKNVKLNLVTSFKMLNVYSGALDLQGLESIINNNGIVQNYQNIHSKVYIFDDKKIVITSANLTNGGFLKNFEYGVFSNNKELVNQAVDDFSLITNNEKTGLISIDIINTAREILSKVPAQKRPKFPKIEDMIEDTDDTIEDSYNSIVSSLAGWKLEVFECTAKIRSSIFDLRDFKEFEPLLHKRYPSNRNIMPKVRQQLQFLRDLGLIEFLGNGQYRKLWK